MIDPPREEAVKAVESVLRQSYPKFEILVCRKCAD